MFMAQAEAESHLLGDGSVAHVLVIGTKAVEEEAHGVEHWNQILIHLGRLGRRKVLHRAQANSASVFDSGIS